MGTRKLYELPYIRLCLKFELTNQDSASGENCPTSMLTVETAKA